MKPTFGKLLFVYSLILVLLTVQSSYGRNSTGIFPSALLQMSDTLRKPFIDTADTTFLRRQAMIHAAEPHHTIYMIDISNSMKEESRLDSLKTGLYYLIHLQRETDRLSLITFNDSAKIIQQFLPPTEKERIAESIDTLITKGSTNVQDALLDAYKIVDSTHRQYQGKTKLVLITDGLFDLNKKIRKKIDTYDKAGIPLSIVLMGSLHDVETIEFLEKICEKGKGTFYYMRKYNLYEVLAMEASN